MLSNLVRSAQNMETFKTTELEYDQVTTNCLGLEGERALGSDVRGGGSNMDTLA